MEAGKSKTLVVCVQCCRYSVTHSQNLLIITTTYETCIFKSRGWREIKSLKRFEIGDAPAQFYEWLTIEWSPLFLHLLYMDFLLIFYTHNHHTFILKYCFGPRSVCPLFSE